MLRVGEECQDKRHMHRKYSIPTLVNEDAFTQAGSFYLIRQSQAYRK
jgi:hypothetical protein